MLLISMRETVRELFTRARFLGIGDSDRSFITGMEREIFNALHVLFVCDSLIFLTLLCPALDAPFRPQTQKHFKNSFYFVTN
jgi:hypothetical protein